jgi:iron-regulated transporter 1
MPLLHRDQPAEIELRALTLIVDENDENEEEQLSQHADNSILSSSAAESESQLPILVPGRLQRAQHWLYATHGVAQFSEVAWQFSLSFFLSAITNHQSLFWVSCYGVSMGAAVSLGTPMAGYWIDTTKVFNRWQVVQRIMSIEVVCVAVASLSVVVLLLKTNTNKDSTTSIHVPSMVLLNVFGSLAQVCDQILIVVFERDWVVEMSRISKDETWLTNTNVGMRQIDLSAKVLGPALAAAALPLLAHHNFEDGEDSGDDWSRAACVMGLMNMTALLLQFVGSSIIYRLVPQLEREQSAPVSTHESDAQGKVSTGIFGGLHVYLSLPIAGAGLALAILYLNGLTFGNGILTAHLLHRGMPVQSIGLFRGLAAVLGLAGTWVFYASQRCSTLKLTALWSLCYEFVCLLLAALSLIVASDSTSILSLSLLIGGVLASRTGLWVFDLAVTQLQQECVPDDSRGAVGGVQQSLNSIFKLLCFAIGLFFPQDFGVYVWTAFGSVGLALGLYGCFFRSLP